MNGGGLSKTKRTQREVWAEILANKQARGCTCPFDENSTYEELRALGAGCTDPATKARWDGKPLETMMSGWVCPVLDKARTYRSRTNATALT